MRRQLSRNHPHCSVKGGSPTSTHTHTHTHAHVHAHAHAHTHTHTEYTNANNIPTLLAQYFTHLQYTTHNYNTMKSLHVYLIRKGQARSTQSVVLMKVTPAGENGGQVLTMRLRIAPASSSFRYIIVWVFRAQHTCRGRGTAWACNEVYIRQNSVSGSVKGQAYVHNMQ